MARTRRFPHENDYPMLAARPTRRESERATRQSRRAIRDISSHFPTQKRVRVLKLVEVEQPPQTNENAVLEPDPDFSGPST